MTDCYLEFHFHHDYLPYDQLVLTDPLIILQTDDVNQVRHIINQAEDYSKKGYVVAGYIGYEAAPAFNPLMRVHKGNKLPLVWFGIFKEPQSIKRESPVEWDEKLEWRPTISRNDYDEAISCIHNDIRDGNTYQVNYTLRLNADFKGDDYAFFLQLTQAQRANYTAYLDIGRYSIMSASPELFFAWNGTDIETKPMKGTVRRGMTTEEDEKQKAWLAHSKKDQSENVMIVDLLRNDLGRVAKTGSVTVTKLFEVEAYPTVYQMTSTIKAETKEGTSLTKLFEALFPCGSITGAPKMSTMNCIHQLETGPREVYCGAIGFILPNQTAVFNVPIRTVWVDKAVNVAEYGVGGGITWESTASNEYDEVIAKGEVLSTKRRPFKLLESLLLKDSQVFLLNEHIDRMKQSADYFQFAFNESMLRQLLLKAADEHPEGAHKLRVMSDDVGEILVEASPLRHWAKPITAVIARESISKNNPFLYHKTTMREVYEKAREQVQEGVMDVLLWNEEGYVTEFTNGNIVCKINGQLVTPPIKDGLLAGTYRNALLRDGTIVEKSILIRDLYQAEEIWFINSVRCCVPVEISFGPY